MTEKDHINYSIDHLQKYLNGELTDKEMQALEKEALDDPFLADTIEGLEESRKQSVSFDSGIADLNKRLIERVRKQTRKKGNVFMFPRWQVAASIILIAALTIFTVIVVQNKNVPKTISTVNKKNTKEVLVPAKPAIAPVSPDKIPVEKQAEKSEPMRAITPASAPVAGIAKTNKKDSIRFVQGFIQDDSGNAIEAATVRLTDQSGETSTDSNGYFKLQLDNNRKKKEIAINSIGFDSLRTPVSSDSSLVKLRMQRSSASLNDVVVIGYGTQKRKDATGSVTIVNEKTFGPGEWNSLIKFINDNKKISTADSVFKGEEIISFIVTKKGKLSTIEVVKSISPSHDAEVIRLLKSGPKLHPDDGKKQKYQIRIVFD